MASVIELSEYVAQHGARGTQSPPQRAASGQILIFTGVRYERMEEPSPQHCAKRAEA